MRSVIVLGSTGSIGTQGLDIIARHCDKFSVSGLSAAGTRPKLLAEQAIKFNVPRVSVFNPDNVQSVRDALDCMGAEGKAIEISSGEQSVSDMASQGADVVLNGITGSVGLKPSIAALQSGSQLALANKESVVAGGHLLFDAQVRENQINPVDSEHSAVWQSMRSGKRSEIAKLIITASGGPFRGKTREELRNVTVSQAFAHPTWDMGPVVTINSSTLMNKGLEVIEASRLFDIPPERIEVAVHPQSVVHSMVEFCDGAVICQASPPDMHLPLALGLSAPDRLDNVAAACDWTSPVSWTFEPVDNQTFPAVKLALQCLAASEKHTAAMNAANEQAVKAFIENRIGYLDIVDTVAETVETLDDKLRGEPLFESVEQVGYVERKARRIADSVADKTSKKR